MKPNYIQHKILLKRSLIQGQIPDKDSFEYGELCVNIVDGILFFKNEQNVILHIQGKELTQEDVNKLSERSKSIDEGQITSDGDNLIIRGVKKFWKFLGVKKGDDF